MFWLLLIRYEGNELSQYIEYILGDIRRKSDYIIGLVTPAIGANKSKKLTQLIAPVHNDTRQRLNEKQYTWLHRHQPLGDVSIVSKVVTVNIGYLMSF